jgi:hypothetical protein
MDSGSPCNYKDPETAEECRRTPTTAVAVGMTAPHPSRAGRTGDFVYTHACEEHLPLVRERFGRERAERQR